MAARPFEQVLEEVEQAGVRPLHVLEDEDRRRLLREPLEEDPPGGEEVLLVPGRALLEPEQVGETRLDPAPLLRVGDVQLDRRAQLRRAPRTAPRPRRCRSASAPSPPAPSRPRLRRRRGSGRGANGCRRRGRRRTSRTPRRAGTCRCRRFPSTETSCAFFSSAEPWKSSLTRRSSRSRPTNGASRPRDLSAPPRPAVTRSARKSGSGSALPFSSCSARVLVGDRRLGRSLRRLAHEHSAGPGNRLDARGGVDQVAGNHALLRAAGRDRRLTREHARPRPEVWRAHLAPSSATACTRSSAARTARSASSSFATGAPHTAITASPMNFSTVPP